MVIFHIRDRRILEVFLGPENCLCTVRVVREKGCVHGLIHFAAVVREGHVLFLVNCLQFGVETSDYRIFESVCFNFRPVLDFIGRDVLHIYRHVLRCEGIRSLGPDYGHEFVVFVRNGDF